MNIDRKWLVGWFIPHTLARYWQARAARERETRAVETFAAQRGATRAASDSFRCAAAVESLVRLGASEFDVLGASIPEASLALCAQTLDRYLDVSRPLTGLHIGNFLGVSLAYFLDWIGKRHSDSLLLSVDPNITYRGIENPQNYVAYMTGQLGLTRQHLLLVGYTLEKNSEDVFALAPEYTLPHLAHLGVTLDFALIDGNHDVAYLKRELQMLTPMLKPGGVLILDDVTEQWELIRNLYGELRSGAEFVQVARDERLGILLKPKPAN